MERYLHLLACPECGSQLHLSNQTLICDGCVSHFQLRGNIPLMTVPLRSGAAAEEVTVKVKSFYEANPFPDYDETEDLASLLQKARTGVFARLLDEQIPFGSRVLECGCGTGQLTNFLGIAHRTVFGTDLAVNSLDLAEAFRQLHQLDRVFFLQMDLFKPVFREASFDFVICNGVLHHTYDPKAGLLKLAQLLRPEGYIVIGLYHRYGRLLTDLRRLLFRIGGEGLSFLDPRIRRMELKGNRRSAWFADQYRNPHESKHTISEVLRWLEDAELRFVKSIPKTRLMSRFSVNEQLFQTESPGNPIERFLREGGLAFRSDPEGGFFTIIAQKYK